MVTPARLRISLAVFLFTLSNMVSAQQGEWTWMHGCNTSGCSPTWGTQGVPDPANTPGGVYAPYYWVDAQKNLWIYGGIAGAGYFNAMWKFDPSVIEWTWMAGSNFSYQPPVYGSLGQFGATYTPGYRAFGSVSWTDNDGKFWLFGGDGWAGTLADLWQYDPSVNQWALMNGSPTAGVSANYGTKGVPAATNTPGSRREGNATWVDADNNLWMFGGETSGFFRNDMWKYDVSLGQWVWMAGSSQLNQAATYGTQGVADSLNVPSGRSSYCKWQDADGNFWLFGGGNWNSAQYYADLWKYDPAVNVWTWMSGASSANAEANAGNLCDSSASYYPAARFEDRSCATDPCGNFWMWGGIHNTGNSQTNNDLWVYRPQQNDWTYSNGPLTYNGSGVYGTQGQSSPSNVPGARMGSIMWFDSTGNLWMFGGSPSWFLSYYNDVWRFVPDPECPAIINCSTAPVAALSASDTTLCEKFCIDFTDQSQNDPVSWQWIFEGSVQGTSTEQNPQDICYDDPGFFGVTLIVTNSSGATDTLEMPDFITVYPNPFAPTITQDGNVLTSSFGTTYQWFLNGDVLSGATNQSYEITESGLYTVVITDENGCSAQVSYQAYLVGIDDPQNPFYIYVSGNPVSDELIVKVACYCMPEVSILNVIGQTIVTISPFESSSPLLIRQDVSTLPAGTYFLKATSGSNTRVMRWIKD